ncbi:MULTISPECIES: 2OG-Fe dioxygenase family protein [Photorhabdus]|uniref:2OG-Fe dioxygenase family protein n=2 Tax=Photorhabdus asymbiotica TaxID=291112 RepID=C7BHG5_PHOAA|nr:2OG-Fe dioxygenase family protein [Photorhabdus asymbiotica]RKS54504.1 2-oxoglutarate-Fe(II)-dependent dioxygenase family protein [Photorhabdus asymbiotica]CAQ82333.1 conserved hypothetical protein [Photorhabdus asymbiotica]
MQNNNLKSEGFSHYQLNLEYSEKDKSNLLNEFSKLEPDAYAPDKVSRFRRYGNAIIIPWLKEPKLYWLPTVKDDNGNNLSGYDQGSNNPEHKNMRYFSALSDEVKNNALLESIILDDFKSTFGLNDHYLPIYVGIHFVKVKCTDNKLPGFSSPDCFHQDGEPFTFAHLINRSENIDGGINYIGKVSARNKKIEDVSDDEIISQFTLENFLESFAVCDELVSHYISHITLKEDDGEAERSMILIDFSMTKQDI